MSEPTNLNVSVTAGAGGRKTSISRILTLDRVVEWIRNQGLDEYTENGLIEMASRYPNAALPVFRRNFNVMLQRVRANRKKEQNGVYNEEEVIVPAASPSTLSLDEAFGAAFQPVPRKVGPEFQPTRRPLFDKEIEDEPNARSDGGQAEEWKEDGPEQFDSEPVLDGSPDLEGESTLDEE